MTCKVHGVYRVYCDGRLGTGYRMVVAYNKGRTLVTLLDTAGLRRQRVRIDSLRGAKQYNAADFRRGWRGLARRLELRAKEYRSCDVQYPQKAVQEVAAALRQLTD